MNDATTRPTGRVYRGIWKVLSDWFRVPAYPPTLPALEGEFIKSFRPSPRYLSYLKLHFWIALIVVETILLIGWIMLFISDSKAGMLLIAPMLVVAVVPFIIAYIAIHLRYDTMWYVMTDRSLRCRRGIWVILEHTITFENVQNVHINRGPIQYFFDISTIVIETAGAAEGEDQNHFAVGNKAIMEGIDNPTEIRELIMERLRLSKSAGLGDEPLSPQSASRGWSIEHIQALRQILDEIRMLK